MDQLHEELIHEDLTDRYRTHRCVDVCPWHRHAPGQCYSAARLGLPRRDGMIYLIEDNEALRRSLTECLQEVAGLQVGGACGTEGEAVHWLNRHGSRWRVAVVDLFLLEGSGLGVIARCRQRHPWQKMVVLTHYATPDIRRRALALGADAVFDKASELDAFFAYCAEHAGCELPALQG